MMRTLAEKFNALNTAPAAPAPTVVAPTVPPTTASAPTAVPSVSTPPTAPVFYKENF